MSRGPPSKLTLLRDADHAALAARGDRAAFAELAHRAAAPARDLLRRMGAEAALADDLTQDALLAALRSVADYRGEAPFASWVMRIAARLYLKRRRKDARLQLMADPVSAEAASPSGEAGSIARLDLDQALAALSAPERLCVSLCHGAGMTHEEIAASLQVPLGTVKSHVLRGLKKLRKLMTAPEEERA